MAPPPKKKRPDWAERLSKAVAVLGTQDSAARVADVGLRQMRRYLSGDSQPTSAVLTKLAQASGFSLEWLLTGKGPERAPPNLRRLTRVAAENGGRAEVLVGAALTADRLGAMQSLVATGLAATYGGALTNEEFAAVVAGVLDAVAPGNLPPENWEELARVAVASHAGSAGVVVGRPRRP